MLVFRNGRGTEGAEIVADPDRVEDVRNITIKGYSIYVEKGGGINVNIIHMWTKQTSGLLRRRRLEKMMCRGLKKFNIALSVFSSHRIALLTALSHKKEEEVEEEEEQRTQMDRFWNNSDCAIPI